MIGFTGHTGLIWKELHTETRSPCPSRLHGCKLRDSGVTGRGHFSEQGNLRRHPWVKFLASRALHTWVLTAPLGFCFPIRNTSTGWACREEELPSSERFLTCSAVESPAPAHSACPRGLFLLRRLTSHSSHHPPGLPCEHFHDFWVPEAEEHRAVWNIRRKA